MVEARRRGFSAHLQYKYLVIDKRKYSTWDFETGNNPLNEGSASMKNNSGVQVNSNNMGLNSSVAVSFQENSDNSPQASVMDGNHQALNVNVQRESVSFGGGGGGGSDFSDPVKNKPGSQSRKSSRLMTSQQREKERKSSC
jgi:hypothetical protein